MPTIVESTISKTGTPDYSTLQSWEDASPADLTTADQVWKGVIQETTDNFVGTSNTLLGIGGITTDATRYVWLTVKDGSSFTDNSSNPLKWDDTKGASLTVTTGKCISNGVGNSLIERIQCRSVGGTTNVTLGHNNNSTDSVFKNMLVESDSDLPTGDGGDGNRWINCVAIQTGEAKSCIINTAINSGRTTYFHNCTFLALSSLTTPPTNVIDSITGRTNNYTNCAFYGASALVDAGTNNYTTCATDLGSPPTGVTQISFANADFVGTTSADLDLTIGVSSFFIDSGTTDATFASSDIFDKSRPIGSAYDIGAFEFGVDRGFEWNKMLLLGVG